MEFISIKAVEGLISWAYNQGFADCRGYKKRDYKDTIAYEELQKLMEAKNEQ